MTAASTVCFSGIVFPPLMPSSDVMTVSADAGEGGREGGEEEREGQRIKGKRREKFVFKMLGQFTIKYPVLKCCWTETSKHNTTATNIECERERERKRRRKREHNSYS